MAKRLHVPPELEHLIEKREEETDRRKQRRRRSSDQRQEDLGPLGAIESAGELDAVPTVERRSGDRRRKPDRRAKKRRKADS